jgi:hypothetical protein
MARPPRVFFGRAADDWLLVHRGGDTRRPDELDVPVAVIPGCLLLGAVLLPFTNLLTLVPVAAWNAPVFLLRFARTD